MHPVGTIGTALVVTLVATGGAYLGAFGDRLFGEGAPAPVVKLTRQVPLPSVSVPIYSGGDRIGFCVLDAVAEMPNSYSDEEFQIAVSTVADAMIRELSVQEGAETAEARCRAREATTAGTHEIVSAQFFRTVREAQQRR